MPLYVEGCSSGTAYVWLLYTPDGQNYPGGEENGDLVKFNVVDVEITNPIQPNNKFVFNYQSPGVCSFTAMGTTGITELDANLEWSLTGISGSTLTSNPSPAKGPNVTFTYTTLPSLNSEFGEKTLTLTYPLISSDCNTDTETVEIYYQFGGQNWPGAGPMNNPQNPLEPPSWNHTWANWYYYYKQTEAHTGCIYYRNMSMCSPWDHPNYVAYVGALFNPHPVLSYTDPRSGISIQNSGEELYGIDCFAWASRHEMKHHDDYTDWWGAGGVNPAHDQDNPNGDRVPDYLELGISPADGGPFYNYTPTTHGPVSFFYGYDDQVECLFSQDPWTKDTHKDVDWAYHGSRWHP